MANNAGKILSRIKDEEIDWVDLRFTDPKGKWQHLTMASAVIDDDMLTDGFMFDGSSIAGWMFPAVSTARDTMVCSAGEGFSHCSDQIFHANSASSLRSIVAGSHGPPSICTSIR